MEEKTIVKPEEIVEEQPKTGFLDKLKIHKFKILGGVLGILVFAGAIFGAYKLGQRQVQIGSQPTPTPGLAATPTPDLTADWKVFRSEEYGFEFKYPHKLQVEENKYPGERGYAYCLSFKKVTGVKLPFGGNVYAGAAGCYFEDFGIGGITTDFEAGRSGMFTDTRGYRKEGSRIVFKFAGTKEFEIPQELVKQIFNNPNGVEIVIVEGKTYSESPFPIMGTPGEGYLGALINTKYPYLTGLAVVYSKTSTLLSEEEFYQVLSTFKFLEESLEITSTPTPTPFLRKILYRNIPGWPVYKALLDFDFQYPPDYSPLQKNLVDFMHKGEFYCSFSSTKRVGTGLDYLNFIALPKNYEEKIQRTLKILNAPGILKTEEVELHSYPAVILDLDQSYKHYQKDQALVVEAGSMLLIVNYKQNEINKNWDYILESIRFGPNFDKDYFEEKLNECRG